jgi:hypothetical protein
MNALSYRSYMRIHEFVLTPPPQRERLLELHIAVHVDLAVLLELIAHHQENGVLLLERKHTRTVSTNRSKTPALLNI